MVCLREVDLALDVSLDGGLGGVVPVRRGEDAERNRNSGVKVQIAGLVSARVLLLECLSADRKEDKKGSLASW